MRAAAKIKRKEKITSRNRITFIFCLLSLSFISCGKGGPGGGLSGVKKSRGPGGRGVPVTIKSGVSEAQASRSRASMRLDSSAAGGMVSKFDVIIYNIGNVTPRAYNGTARIEGTITFARVYSASQNLHQGIRTQAPTQFTCPSVGIPYRFSCQARFANGFFACEQARIHTGNYEIEGHIVKSNQLDRSADVIDLLVIGPCAHKRGYGLF